MSDKMDDAVKTLSEIVDLPDDVVSLSKVATPAGAKQQNQPIGEKIKKDTGKKKPLSEMSDEELDAAITALKKSEGRGDSKKPDFKKASPEMKALQAEKSRRFVAKRRK